jgi:hypothetical protein
VDTELISEDELDYRLHKCDPANRAAIGNKSFRAAVADMQRNIEADAQRQAPSKLSGRPIYRRRWVTRGAATAAVAVASLVGVKTLTGGSGGAGLPLAVSSAAAAQLTQVAKSASGQAMPTAGQWEYLEAQVEETNTAGANGATLAYTDKLLVQDWNSLDGQVRQRITVEGFSFLTPQDKATYLANQSAFHSGQLGHGAMASGVVEDHMLRTSTNSGGSQPVWETSPPSDPQTLLTEIWSQFEGRTPRANPNLAAVRPGVLWQGLADLLLNSTDAQLRATAYKALAYVPETQVLGDQADQVGRSGVAIRFTGDGAGITTTLIVSPTTGDLLEYDKSLTAAAGGLPAGTVTRREDFLKRAIVGSSASLPGGGTQPFASASQTTTTAAQG